MISHGKDIKVFCGNANRPLAEEICRLMGTKLGEAEVKGFATVRSPFPCTKRSAAAMCSLSSPPASPSMTT